MRLGSYPCVLKDSQSHRAYGVDLIHERHRHRYELNNDYTDILTQYGMRFSGTSPTEDWWDIEPMITRGRYPIHPDSSRVLLGPILFKAFVQAAKMKGAGR